MDKNIERDLIVTYNCLQSELRSLNKFIIIDFLIVIKIIDKIN